MTLVAAQAVACAADDMHHVGVEGSEHPILEMARSDDFIGEPVTSLDESPPEPAEASADELDCTWPNGPIQRTNGRSLSISVRNLSDDTRQVKISISYAHEQQMAEAVLHVGELSPDDSRAVEVPLMLDRFSRIDIDYSGLMRVTCASWGHGRAAGAHFPIYFHPDSDDWLFYDHATLLTRFDEGALTAKARARVAKAKADRRKIFEERGVNSGRLFLPGQEEGPIERELVVP